MDTIMSHAELQIAVAGAAEEGVGSRDLLMGDWSKDKSEGALTMTETTGKATGNPLTDRRAILYGILSFLCTLRRVAEVYGAECIGDNPVINLTLQQVLWCQDTVSTVSDIVQRHLRYSNFPPVALRASPSSGFSKSLHQCTLRDGRRHCNRSPWSTHNGFSRHSLPLLSSLTVVNAS